MNQALLDKIESEQFRKDAADFGVGGVLGRDPVERWGGRSWVAAVLVTPLAPVPIAPVLAQLAWRRPSLHARLAWLVAFGAAALWSPVGRFGRGGRGRRRPVASTAAIAEGERRSAFC